MELRFLKRGCLQSDNMTTDLYRRGQPRDQLMDSWPWLILRTLRCKDAMVARTSLKKSICALSVFIAIIPTDLLCQIWGKSPRVEFVGTNPVSKREIKFCCRLFTPSIKRLIRQFYDEVVQKRQRNVLKSVVHVPIFFPQLKLFFFMTDQYSVYDDKKYHPKFLAIGK